MTGVMRTRVIWPPVLFGLGALGVVAGLHALVHGHEKALTELPVRAFDDYSSAIGDASALSLARPITTHCRHSAFGASCLPRWSDAEVENQTQRQGRL
jgi:hypothetical protein